MTDIRLGYLQLTKDTARTLREVNNNLTQVVKQLRDINQTSQASRLSVVLAETKLRQLDAERKAERLENELMWFPTSTLPAG